MELPDLGKNCSVCNRNDYLPFKCSYCDKIVCIDHKTNHGAECPLNSPKFQADNHQVPLDFQSLKKACDFCHKITLKLELVECPQCGGSHCLYHRHQVQHGCKQLQESQANSKLEAELKANIKHEALEKLRLSTKSSPIQHETSLPTFVDPKKRDLARRIRLMKIKQSAKGPPNVLQEDKIYFEIRFLNEPKSTLSNEVKNNTSIRIFATPKHTLGRMIDWSADELGLKNNNHIVDADQLVFKKKSDNGSEGLIKLDTQKCFGDYLDNKLLQDGDEIILTYEVESK